MKKLRETFENKKILVTGGTGCIGSEIVRSLLAYNPKVVRIFSKGKVVGDYCCGAEFFLNLVKGVAKQIIAVEPFNHYRPPLKEKGWADTVWITEKKGNGDEVDSPC